MIRKLFTRDELTTQALQELQEIARSLGIAQFQEGTKREKYIEAILRVAGRKETTPAREVKLDNYQPLRTNHPPLYKVCNKGSDETD